MRRLATTFACLLLASALSAFAQDTSLPPWHPGAHGDLAFYTSSFLATTAYRKPDKTANEFASDGGFGPLNRAWDSTHQGRWLIEEQRYASDAIIAGLITHRQDLIDNGRRIFDWGFRMEQPDGGFNCPDHFHSASFFIEAAVPFGLALASFRYDRAKPGEGEFHRSKAQPCCALDDRSAQ